MPKFLLQTYSSY